MVGRRLLTIGCVLIVLVPATLWVLLWLSTTWPNKQAMDRATSDAQVEASGDYGVFRSTLTDPKVRTAEAAAQHLARRLGQGHSRLLAQAHSGIDLRVTVVASGDRFANSWGNYVTKTAIVCFTMTGAVGGASVGVVENACPNPSALAGLGIDGNATRVGFPRWDG